MNAMLTAGAPMPETIGACADMLHDVRELRLAMEKEVEAVKKREAEIKDHIIESLSAGADTGAAGQRYRVQIVTKTKPRLEDWAAFTQWVVANDRFDCVQRRLSDKAVMDMLEAGAALPGIERMHVKDVSITKI